MQTLKQGGGAVGSNKETIKKKNSTNVAGGNKSKTASSLGGLNQVSSQRQYLSAHEHEKVPGGKIVERPKLSARNNSSAFSKNIKIYI